MYSMKKLDRREEKQIKKTIKELYRLRAKVGKQGKKAVDNMKKLLVRYMKSRE